MTISLDIHLWYTFTLALASLVASASAAMARCNCTGSRTSLLQYTSYEILLLLYQHLHLHPLHLDTPGVGGLVQGVFHPGGDLLSLRQYVSLALGTQNISNVTNTSLVWAIVD